MAKKRSVSSARAKQHAKNVLYIPDSELELIQAIDVQLRRARRVGQPLTGNAKHLIAIRIAPSVLAKFRRLSAKQSKPYQTYIHEILERAANKK